MYTSTYIYIHICTYKHIHAETCIESTEIAWTSGSFAAVSFRAIRARWGKKSQKVSSQINLLSKMTGGLDLENYYVQFLRTAQSERALVHKW